MPKYENPLHHADPFTLSLPFHHVFLQKVPPSGEVLQNPGMQTWGRSSISRMHSCHRTSAGHIMNAMEGSKQGTFQEIDNVLKSLNCPKMPEKGG